MNKNELKKIAAETAVDSNILEVKEKNVRKSKVDKVVKSIAEDAVAPSIQTPFAKQKTVRVSLDQIESDPINFRHEVDYHDKQLQNSILTTGGLLKAPIVTPSGEKTDDGRIKYLIVGGNRSTYNLREVLKSKGISESDYQLDVIVREYSGEKNQKHIQKILEMVMDNESQQAMSPIDLMHAYTELERSGLSRSDIAEKFGKTPAHVSQIMKFNMLPETIQNLMHFESNKDRLAKVADEDFYRTNGIEFEKQADGSYEIYGVGYKNGMTMCSIFQRRPAKNAKKADVAHWEQHVIDVQDFFLRSNIIEAAQRMSSSAFEDYLRKQVSIVGLIEIEEVEAAPVEKAKPIKKAQPVHVDSEEVEVPVKVADISEEVEQEEVSVQDFKISVQPEAVEIKKPTPAAKVAPVEKPAKIEKTINPSLSSSSYADMLEAGSIELSFDWTDKLSEKVKMGDHFAERVLKWLILNDILVEA